jgi:anti-sigma factor RsiW
MNQDLELKIQALLDGELSGRQAAQLEQLLATDAEARALCAELKMAKTLLAGNEPELKLPETREFYWSKIHRQIEHAEVAEPAARTPFWLAWRRYFAPIGGVAIVTLLAVFSMKFYDVGLEDASNHHLAEIENLSEHAGSLSFRSQSENMFVVWVYKKDQQPQEAEPDFSDDTVVE